MYRSSRGFRHARLQAQTSQASALLSAAFLGEPSLRSSPLNGLIEIFGDFWSRWLLELVKQQIQNSERPPAASASQAPALGHGRSAVRPNSRGWILSKYQARPRQSLLPTQCCRRSILPHARAHKVLFRNSAYGCPPCSPFFIHSRNLDSDSSSAAQKVVIPKPSRKSSQNCRMSLTLIRLCLPRFFKSAVLSTRLFS